MDLFAKKKSLLGKKKLLFKEITILKIFLWCQKTFFGGKSFLVQIIFGKIFFGNRNLLGKLFFGENFFFSKTCFFLVKTVFFKVLFCVFLAALNSCRSAVVQYNRHIPTYPPHTYITTTYHTIPSFNKIHEVKLWQNSKLNCGNYQKLKM